MPLRFFERDQRGELEQVDKSRPWDLNAERRFGHGEIAALDRPLKDRPRMSLRRQRPPSLGPDGVVTLSAANSSLRTERGPSW